MTELDLPLLEILQTDVAAQKPQKLGPEAGASLEAHADKAVVRSSASLRGARFPKARWPLATGLAGVALYDRNWMLVRIDPTVDPMETAIVGVLSLAVLGFAGVFAMKLWGLGQAAEVTVDRQHVSYQGQRSEPSWKW